MAQTFGEALQLLQGANDPEEVFGHLHGNEHGSLKRRYRDIAVIVHPDHNPGRSREAHEAFRLLQGLYAAAQQRVSRDSRGSTPLISVTTSRRTYAGSTAPISGDLADLYPVDADCGRVLLKVARTACDNDQLQTEARTLNHLDRELRDNPLRAHFPRLIEHVLVPDATGAARHVNVLLAEAGYVSLADVLVAYPQGIAVADAAWMFNRVLAALGTIHMLGVVHGAVTPAHVLIRPSDHNGMLIDWCYSVPVGEPLRGISPPYAADYPPEARLRQPATPATDLYMAARCMVRLLGGVEVDDLPGPTAAPVRALLRAALIPSPHRRANDAWQVFDDMEEILRRLYGAPRFRPFHMPAT